MGWFNENNSRFMEGRVDSHSKMIESICAKLDNLNRMDKKIADLEGQISFMMQQLRAVADHMGVEFDTIQVENPCYPKPQPIMMDKIICKKRKAKK